MSRNQEVTGKETRMRSEKERNTMYQSNQTHEQGPQFPLYNQGIS